MGMSRDDRSATETLPRPKAISAAVSNDVTSRSLIVRCPETESGYGRFLWREAFALLKRDRVSVASGQVCTPPRS